MQNNKIAFSPLAKQIEVLKKILWKNKVLVKTLKLLKGHNLPNWYLAGGAIPQIVWNYYHKFDLNHEISDFDVVYFDDKDLSYEAEDNWIKTGKKIFKNIPVEVEIRNEARVHLWYQSKFGKEIGPYSCAEEAIYSFPTTASATGVSLNKNDKLGVFAPHGLTDLFGLIVRANKIQIPRQVFEEKSKRWKKAWPKLTIIPWEY